MLFLIKIILILVVLLNVALVTLFERKVLSYIQLRKGPNKLGFIGLLQPFADALKLMSKEKLESNLLNKMMFIMAPLMALILMLMYWLLVNYNMFMMIQESCFMFLYIMVISSLSVYVIMFSGWSSNSKYALLGSYRGIAQIISYEVFFSFLVISIFMFSSSLGMKMMLFLQKNWVLLLSMAGVMMFWLVVVLAETNRTPFDLSEGESELVSGFNIEYGGIGFAVLFMAEYGNILFMGWLTSVFFMNMNIMFMMLIVMVIMAIRGTYIRYRYDKLMMLSWQSVLPYLMMYFFFVNIFIGI